MRDDERGEEVGGGEVGRRSVSELGSFIIAVNDDRERARRGGVVGRGETAGERVEVIESEGEGGYEEVDDSGERLLGIGEENSLLDILDGEEAEIQGGEMDAPAPLRWQRRWADD